MADDVSVAFDELEARAKATATDPLDRIAVRDFVKSVEIGAFQSERDVQQTVRFNVVLEVLPHAAASSDNVDDVLSYDMITEAIEAELNAERLNLLETLAERVAKRILQHPQSARVFVRIEKMDRIAGTLGVEIVRNRTEIGEEEGQEVIVPRVALVSRKVVMGGSLSDWIDGFVASRQPTILCVHPEPSDLMSADTTAARRLRLLAFDQAAWVLAGLVARVSVADSRTELDWAIKNGKIVVWAPSRLVLDAVDGPSTDDPAGLALWLAHRFDAARVLICGAEAPAGSDGGFDVALTPEAV